MVVLVVGVERVLKSSIYPSSSLTVPRVWMVPVGAYSEESMGVSSRGLDEEE